MTQQISFNNFFFIFSATLSTSERWPLEQFSCTKWTAYATATAIGPTTVFGATKCGLCTTSGGTLHDQHWSGSGSIYDHRHASILWHALGSVPGESHPTARISTEKTSYAFSDCGESAVSSEF